MKRADTCPLVLRGVRTEIDGTMIHENLDLEMRRGEVLGLIGASGAGKSVLLRSIIGLFPPTAGTVELFGQNLYEADDEQLAEIKRRWGVLFQANALFSTLSVVENIAVPLREHSNLPEPLLLEIATLKAQMSGLPADSLHKFPSQLSGGLQKRVGVARAIALDPDLVLLDEPTAGLDPLMAHQIDELVASLASVMGLSVLVVTHDLDTLYAICDRVAVLADHKIVATAPVRELERNEHPWIQEFLLGKRSRASVRIKGLRDFDRDAR